jgi:hypothetical protein
VTTAAAPTAGAGTGLARGAASLGPALAAMAVLLLAAGPLGIARREDGRASLAAV